MYIHKITLANIRGFRSLDFDLQRPDKSYAGWTVFTGDNGGQSVSMLLSIRLLVIRVVFEQNRVPIGTLYIGKVMKTVSG